MTIQKLSKTSILQGLNPQGCFEVIIEERIGSTNDFLLDLIAYQSCTRQTAVLAETQTGGRGRNGRDWVSPAGNIYLSVYWPFRGDHQALYGLSLVVGIAIARVLKNNGLHDVQLKWPNDIYWHEQKMGGILIETKPNKSGQIDVIIGVGLNIVTMPEHEQSITQKFTSLETALGQPVIRDNIVSELLNEFDCILKQFCEFRFDGFTNEWKALETNIASNPFLNDSDKITYGK